MSMRWSSHARPWAHSPVPKKIIGFSGSANQSQGLLLILHFGEIQGRKNEGKWTWGRKWGWENVKTHRYHLIKYEEDNSILWDCLHRSQTDDTLTSNNDYSTFSLCSPKLLLKSRHLYLGYNFFNLITSHKTQWINTLRIKVLLNASGSCLLS
jgi:hypothetical protein